MVGETHRVAKVEGWMRRWLGLDGVEGVWRFLGLGDDDVESVCIERFGRWDRETATIRSGAGRLRGAWKGLGGAPQDRGETAHGPIVRDHGRSFDGRLVAEKAKCGHLFVRVRRAKRPMPSGRECRQKTQRWRSAEREARAEKIV